MSLGNDAPTSKRLTPDVRNGKIGGPLNSIFRQGLDTPTPARFTDLVTNEQNLDQGVRQEILAALPQVRAFAISLCGSADRGDDLAHEALTKAIASIDSFKPGANMVVWLIAILHRHFRTEWRMRQGGREGAAANPSTPPADQHDRTDLEDFRRAFARLPDDQREALILVGAAGFSYDDAAKMCDCAVGTIKSRVNRARMKLATVLPAEAEAA